MKFLKEDKKYFAFVENLKNIPKPKIEKEENTI